jgi:hypothetical protein
LKPSHFESATATHLSGSNNASFGLPPGQPIVLQLMNPTADPFDRVFIPSIQNRYRQLQACGYISAFHFEGRPRKEGMMSNEHLSSIDRVGACAATACAVHCLLTPLATAVLPLVAAGMWDGALSRAFLFTSLALAVSSCCWGFRLHRQKRVPTAFVAGIAVLLVANFGLEGPIELFGSVCGAMLLISGHWLNRRACRACPGC